MVDIVDSATRSRMMSGIRGRNTKPEILIRKILHSRGFRYRLHVTTLPGKPDIVLPRYHAVIFVHGCFWHGHSCRLFKWPASRQEFWQTKILANQERDKRAIQLLRGDSWRIATVWECALRGSAVNLEDIAETITAWLKSNNKELEVIE